MKIQRAVPLKKYTTFQIGGPANYFCIAKTNNELIGALNFAKGKKLPFFILGGGSNLLISDAGFRGVVIKPLNTDYKILACRRGRQNTEMHIGAGANLGRIVGATARAELSGLEWAAGVPGTFGGAVRGNAGAFGKDMAQSIRSVDVYDSKAGKIFLLENNGCKFGYRDSIFKSKRHLIILSANLILKKAEKDKILEKMKEYLNYRREKHPQDSSAGSIFKNFPFSVYSFQKLTKKFPELEQFQARKDIPAAFLIAQCGLKGKKIGGAQISEKHPNFIINNGNAKANDVVELINFAKKSVKAKFQIKLTEEIQFLGF
ncbi:MAG: UDP-N-acetylmuramate dehydrogenase [Candidatus Nealsonbacteria bacterium]|nr:UDP-N-acetylmuramate dehydrogenase [Candidatus Nealsonbacteria bacterium]